VWQQLLLLVLGSLWLSCSTLRLLLQGQVLLVLQTRVQPCELCVAQEPLLQQPWH